MQATYVLKLALPKEMSVGEQTVARADLLNWFWQEFGDRGLVGVHEGTVLGPELESAIDASQESLDDDWVGELDLTDVELYFHSEASAVWVRERLLEEFSLEIDGPRVQKEEDWDAKWKASFRGVHCPPWEILPVHLGSEEIEEDHPHRIWLNPGAGFGTGTHESTQICLSELATRGSLNEKRVLDFGSGSGVLSIAAAKLGAKSIDAVEIDSLAIENALENLGHNGLDGRVVVSERLGEGREYDLILANILKPVLLENAPYLCESLKDGGTIILSGLLEKDRDEVLSRYLSLLPRATHQVVRAGDWVGLVIDNYS